MSERLRTLVVDYDPRIASPLRRALIYEGYDLDVATDGVAVLRLARDHPPDLVVLDVLLPGLDSRTAKER